MIVMKDVRGLHVSKCTSSTTSRSMAGGIITIIIGGRGGGGSLVLSGWEDLDGARPQVGCTA